MAKPQYKLINRAEFVAARYDRFLKSKQIIETYGLPAMLTDLDTVFPDMGKPMKDVVICDRCNDEIEDSHMIDLEGVRIYHYDCIKEQLPKNFGGDMSNVIQGKFGTA